MALTTMHLKVEIIGLVLFLVVAASLAPSAGGAAELAADYASMGLPTGGGASAETAADYTSNEAPDVPPPPPRPIAPPPPYVPVSDQDYEDANKAMGGFVGNEAPPDIPVANVVTP